MVDDPHPSLEAVLTAFAEAMQEQRKVVGQWPDVHRKVQHLIEDDGPYVPANNRPVIGIDTLSDAGSTSRLINKKPRPGPPAARTVEFIVRAAGGEVDRFLAYRSQVERWCAATPEDRQRMPLPFMDQAVRPAHPVDVVPARPPAFESDLADKTTDRRIGRSWRHERGLLRVRQHPVGVMLAILALATIAVVTLIYATAPSVTSDTGLANPSLEKYLSTDGSVPELSPPEDGLFGFLLGSPIETVTAQLGTERSRYAGINAGNVIRQWQYGILKITIEADGVGSITSMAVARDNDNSPNSVRVALPDGLVLGTSTVPDLEVAHGSVQFLERHNYENTPRQNMSYRQGPEGSYYATFGCDTTPEGIVPPGTLLDLYSIEFNTRVGG